MKILMMNKELIGKIIKEVITSEDEERKLFIFEDDTYCIYGEGDGMYNGFCDERYLSEQMKVKVGLLTQEALDYERDWNEAHTENRQRDRTLLEAKRFGFV